MHYIITDIHNDSWRFMKLLEKMDLKEDDHLYLLGDLFDRCMDHPDPAGVYFQVLKLGEKCTVIRGNHDHWLANYIFRYYGMDERDRALLQPYPYNSFHLLQERLTEVDLKQLAERILSLVDDIVQNTRTEVAHADLVNIRECKSVANIHAIRVFEHAIHFAAHVSRRFLNAVEQAVNLFLEQSISSPSSRLNVF